VAGTGGVIAKAGERVKPFGYILFQCRFLLWLCGFPLEANRGELKDDQPSREPLLFLERGLEHCDPSSLRGRKTDLAGQQPRVRFRRDPSVPKQDAMGESVVHAPSLLSRVIERRVHNRVSVGAFAAKARHSPLYGTQTETNDEVKRVRKERWTIAFLAHPPRHSSTISG
jgi:hypothetical protein